jgi:hypothetical protein
MINPLVPSFRNAFGFNNQIRIVIDSNDAIEAPKITILPDEMAVTGSFTIRIKNPTHNDYDAVQFICNMKLSVQAVLQENFVVSGRINNMTIQVESVKPFYYEDDEAKKSLEETQDQIDNLVGMFQNQIKSTFKKGFKLPILSELPLGAGFKLDLSKTKVEVQKGFLVINAEPEIVNEVGEQEV